jgi:hypothetical protein
MGMDATPDMGDTPSFDGYRTGSFRFRDCPDFFDIDAGSIDVFPCNVEKKIGCSSIYIYTLLVIGFYITKTALHCYMSFVYYLWIFYIWFVVLVLEI